MKTNGMKMGIFVFVLLAATALGTVHACTSIEILDIGVTEVESMYETFNETLNETVDEEGNETKGFVEYGGTTDNHSTGTLTVRIDGNIVVETEVRTYSYTIGDEVRNPSRVKYFDIDPANGTHWIEVGIEVDEETTFGMYKYVIGDGILEENKERCERVAK